MSQALRPTGWVLLFVSLILVMSCSQDNSLFGPMGPGASHNQTHSPVSISSPNFVSWNPAALAKSSDVDIRVEQLISAATGGSVGNTGTIGVQVDVSAGALREDQSVWLHLLGSDAIKIDFGPSYQFEAPVLITVDLTNANLEGHDAQSLSFWWYNEATALWEMIPSAGNGASISAYVDHFSIYGVGDGPD